MILIGKKFIGNIPVLEVVQEKIEKNALPTVIYYHGFRGEKESSLTLAYKLASVGIRVILPDSPLHGERRNGVTENELNLSFWDIVTGNIEELAEIKSFLELEQLTVPGQIGIGGTSMGGITTFGALRKYSWIKVAAVLMGTPKMREYAQTLIDGFNKTNEGKITEEKRDEVLHQLESYDLSIASKQLQDRPLFIWHGEQDNVVPHEHSVDFYEKVKKSYKQSENIQMILEKDRAHHISRLSIEEAAKWFEEYL